MPLSIAIDFPKKNLPKYEQQSRKCRMNELLQKHGCTNVFTVPEGLRELMADITREVLRDQPQKILDYIANYLSVLLITREHGILAVKILDDLCDCRPSVSEHLLQIGVERNQAEMMSHIIKEEIEEFEPVEGIEKVKEMQVMKKILMRTVLDEEMSAEVCQVVRNAYRDYWYRKKLMEKDLKVHPEETWEIAAERTLSLYKKTKPSFAELTRATKKIQAAYRGYHVRRNLLRHLKPKKKTGPKVELPGPPLDVASSREIDLGPVIDIKVREDDVGVIFDEDINEKLGLQYDPMRTITHVDDGEVGEEQMGTSASRASRVHSKVGGLSKKSLTTRSQFMGTSRESRAGVAGPRESRLPGKMPSATPSQFEAVPSETKAGQRQSRLPSQMPEGPRESRLPSMMIEGPRQSRLPSKMPEGPGQSRAPSQIPSADKVALQRISFSQAPDVIVAEDVPEDQALELPEESNAIAIFESETVPESGETTGGDVAQEIAEDIPDDRTEGDGESVPTTSVPSSAPDTANTTDAEDVGEDVTTEEEG